MCFSAKGTVVEPGAFIEGPAIIGANCQIRHGAYIRPNVIIGDNCVIGNSCELKNVLLFNDCQVPHFNYVGDSILGHHAHLGAGVVLSNFKSLPGNVTVQHERRKNRHGPAQIRRAHWRSCGAGLQQRAQPRQHHRPPQRGVSECQLARRARGGSDCEASR